MAQDRDSLKSPVEIYADEVVRLQLLYWRGFAAQVQQAQAAQAAQGAQGAVTPAATGPDLSVMLPLAGAAVFLLLILRR